MVEVEELHARLLGLTYHRASLVANAIYSLLACFIAMGLVERLGYLYLRWTNADKDEDAGCLPSELPSVCTQLPMYNESAVAVRAINAACSLDWPRDRYEVQVLDDSSDEALRELVDATAAEWRARGVSCHVLRRSNRAGYKAGALEAGRRQTQSEYLALFDADFVPSPDFLLLTLPRFYSVKGEALRELALVQAQWSHLNMDDSLLTLAQSLWIDDHHTSQMGWRSTMWRFVNFTGTAGVWRAAAIERAGGWRACSLVEDCELSFRVLFCGYRTRFARVEVPSELPASVTAYKAQQKRWTLGWAQLIRLHLGTLLLRHKCSCVKRVHLMYHMLLSVQWPLWFIWQVITPWLVAMEDELGGGSATHSPLLIRSTRSLKAMVYFGPLALHMFVAAGIAAVERHQSHEAKTAFGGGRSAAVRLLLLFMRAVPCAALSMGMLPHQACAWTEGLFSKTSEFETTPKNGSVGGVIDGGGTPASSPSSSSSIGGSSSRVRTARVHWYVVVEAAFVLYQAAWLAYFTSRGHYGAAGSTALPLLAVGGLCCCYGDDLQGRPSWDCAAPRLMRAWGASLAKLCRRRQSRGGGEASADGPLHMAKATGVDSLGCCREPLLSAPGASAASPAP